ncbi:hypothetical protein [Winogradskyella sp.]|uniref:hypothetical protein n=1 Tax=Winogradskyella sp. TaxID=1883156 RepID=UPI003AB22264
MKKTFVILISLTIFISCVENKKQPVAEIEESNFENEYVEFDPIKYVSNPEKSDTLCISEIDRAKNEIKRMELHSHKKLDFYTDIIDMKKNLKNSANKMV